MMLAVIALLSAAPVWSTLDDAGRGEALTTLRQLPLLERVVRASEGFLGTPYVVSPLGEGSGHDTDPRVRFDGVDCLTMVEQSLALSLAADQAGLVPLLDRIRYFGEPAWNTRNHIMEAQWLPSNQTRGFVRNVTKVWGGAATKRVTKTLSAATWKQKSAQGLQLDEASQPTGEFALDIIPAAKAVAALEHAPAGLMVVVVRADRATLVTRVSHVAVLVQGPHGPMLRHASRSHKRVVDEPLARYLARNLDFASWTIEGLAVYEPLEPSSAK